VAGSERRSFSGDGAAAELLRLRLRSLVEEGEREVRATERVERPGGSGRRPDQVKPVGRGASTTPAYGRHVAGAGWSEAGAARAGERGGGGRPGRCLGRKGGGVGPAAPAPFSIFFFEFLFSNSFLNSFGPFKNHFHLFLPKAKLFQNKNPTTLF